MLEFPGMSFTVRIANDLVHADAGSTMPLAVEVANRGDDADRFELMVEGIDPEWVAIPDPTFSVDPHDLSSEKVFFKPPRVSESVAGTYPFVVKARSLNSGEVRSAQGALEIKPFHHISVDVSPRRATVSPFSREAIMQATVMNLGNSEQTIQLHASDPDDSVTCDFDSDQVTVPPGAQKAVEFGASSTRRPLFSGPRLFGVSVSGRSVSNPSVAGSGQFQLEQRALMSPGALAFIALVTMLIAAWILLIPKPPVVDAFSVDRKEVILGESIVLRWRASNADSVEIYNGESLVDANQPSTGFVSLRPDKVGEVSYNVRAVTGNKRSNPVSESVLVKAPPVVPDPVIDSFRLEPKQAQLGRPVIVRYQVRNATRILLMPLQIELDPRATEREIIASRVGKIDYTIIAENSAGKSAQATVSVQVNEGSQASIDTFTVFPTSLEEYGGIVRITWQVKGAVKADLVVDGQVTSVDPSGGSLEIQIAKTSEISLKVFDDKSKSVEKKLTVNVKAPPPEPTGGGEGSTTTTTGSTSSTTTGSSATAGGG